MIEYQLIRSIRKTVSISISKEGSVVVRAPQTTSKAFIDKFVLSKKEWINQTIDRIRSRNEQKQRLELTSEEIKQCKTLAKKYLTERMDHFSKIMNVTYKDIKINSAHTRWGSCNAKGSISFTYRLILVPLPLIDYVVVHELAHLKEMNHSKKFWKTVDDILPDYKASKRKLQEWQHGIEIS
jgi:predicted metal-dependent hydrolase